MKKQELSIALLQIDLVWENAEANRVQCEKLINQFTEQVDIVILPEMFTTGFSMNAAALAENMDGTTIQWMRNVASKHSIALSGSLIIAENDKFYNRFIWIDSDGVIEYYDKTHLFTLAGEHNFFSDGNTRKIINYKGWKICPLICYDLRFPELSRNIEPYYDLLIYVANFPATRAYHWQQLLIARAIENQVFTIGVNRVGVDANNIHYLGQSVLIDYEGNVVNEINNYQNVIYLKLDCEKQQFYRERFSFLKDYKIFI
ncbi:MAG: amidohydrolase [Saprospiraceae bacterium]|nr:amidohydrolase [Saprospiraceae bacterium]